MLTNKSDRFLIAGLKARRNKLAQLIDFPVILWSGNQVSKNFAANKFPLRASSHFLYFAGIPLANAAIRIEAGELELFMNDPTPDSTLWHGESPGRTEIGTAIGAERVYPLAELASKTKDAATIALQEATYQQQQSLLGRSLQLSHQSAGKDLQLAQAIVKLRSRHDDLALQELRQAAQVSVEAHKAGIRATSHSTTEAQIRGAMEGVIIAHNMSCAYNSIVTTHGEILHNESYNNPLHPRELLLADVGAETPNGWAADITRTWAVSGKFSSTQKDLYKVVLAAHDLCIAKLAPGVEYQAIHLLAAKVIAEGLVDLGILKGNAEDLVDRDAHALFFPHGVGHLLGLDVHDMEDLGDVAGYASDRTRSDRFGLGYLRLNRPLESGMLVTIEPGFYQVPAILNNPQFRAKYKNVVDWERLAQFSDVRGIRIEDDVLITDAGSEVLTAQLPTKLADIEELASS